MKKFVQAAGSIIISFTLLLGLLCGVILVMAGNPNLMNAMFLQYADPEITGVDVREYPGLAEKITAYLTGGVNSIQTTLSVHGQVKEAFSEKELLHMQDVRNLFTLCHSIFLLCAAISVLMLALSFIRFRSILSVLAGSYIRVSLFIAAVGAALAVWAVIDFHSLFTLFHHVFFTNDLWLLNPKQDLLLQLMPTAFFADYAARIGLWWLLGAALIFLAALLYLKRRKRQA